MVMLLLLASDLLVCSLLFTAFGHLLVWVSWMVGSSLGSLILSSVLVVVVDLLKPGILLLLMLRRFLLGLLIPMFIKSFDTADRGILNRVLSSLGLPGWFRHAYLEYHAHVRLRFKLASGLGEPWTRDGGIPQGCPLSMMFIVALYLPWCGLSCCSGWSPASIVC